MTSTDAVLAVQDVAVSYGDFPALSSTSFVVQPGELIAVVGPNGAGKSTFLKILSGEMESSKGEVFIFIFIILSKP